MNVRLKAVPVLLALLVLTTACGASALQINGTPTVEQVLLNARTVASDLDSYRSTLTVEETTHHPENPALDFTESVIHQVEMESPDKYRLRIANELDVIYSDGTFYSRTPTTEWFSKPAENSFGEEFSTVPGDHPKMLLDKRQLGAASLKGLTDLDGTAVFLVEGLTPPPPRFNQFDGIVHSDRVRLYISQETFRVLRVEVNRDIQDSLREDVGYQVIPGVVEIQTLDIYEYFDHNAEVRIALPTIEQPS